MPIVHLESVFITSMIDVKEGHGIALTDFPGALLLADNPDLIHMVLHGKMAELMAMIEPHTSSNSYHKMKKAMPSFMWNSPRPSMECSIT